LLEAFETEGGRNEAQEIIRGLIDAVVMTPVDGVLHTEVKGDLATMLVLASETRRPPEAEAPEARQVKLVAGTRSDRCRTRVPLNA
jgi:site-specific DNA recombinase